MRRHAVLFAALGVTTCQLALAQEVDLIPDSLLHEEPPPSAAERAAPEAPNRLQARLFLEDAFTGTELEPVVVPYPSTLDSAWQNRASLDVRLWWKPLTSLSFTLSDRLNVYAQEQQSFTFRNAVRNNFREAYAAWEPFASAYLELGRINVRNGAALGWNPTDFFKTRTIVEQASLDPSVIRQNRLGTLMIHGQVIASGGITASVAVAPKLAGAAQITEQHPLGVEPHFASTNAALRVLGTLSFELWDISPQLLGYFERGRTKLGVNATRTIGDALVAYAEWAIGPEQNLVARALEFGRETGTFPNTAQLPASTLSTNQLRNDVAAGVSWTIASTLTLNVEYHFHEAGLGAQQWKDWFALGSAPGAGPALTNELWYVRAYANDQQEPLTQHQGFFRVSWPRAFVNDLELTAFAFVNLRDGSVLNQISAAYYLAQHWTTAVFFSSNLGRDRSERGSFPQRWSGIAQLTLYL